MSSPASIVLIGIRKYERISLLRDDQQLLLGTVILPSDPNLAKLAIQGTGSEAFGIEDIGMVGGKAANFGFLRRAIAENAPDPAIALTFDLWSEFMAQGFWDGTLAESIARDLDGIAFPPDLLQPRPKLDAIRERIRTQADFRSTQKTAILTALGPFNDNRKVRFRSTTNI